MARIHQLLVAVVLGLGFCPASVWAVNCAAEAPLFSIAPTMDIYGQTTFVVAAREKVAGCPSPALNITAAGLPTNVLVRKDTSVGGEVSLTINTVSGAANAGTYDVTYTVTDIYNNVSTVSLPLRLVTSGPPNTTPRLDPVSDMVVAPGETRSFTVGLSDPDNDLDSISMDTLRVDGLPSYSRKATLRASPGLFVCQITVVNNGFNRGIYRVHIRGRDARGGMTISQMRIEIL